MSAPRQGRLATRPQETAATAAAKPETHRGKRVTTLTVPSHEANHTKAGPIPAPRRPADSSGQPLPAALRDRFAPIVGLPAAQAARVHTGSAAQSWALQKQARAVADRTDIYFAEGEYRPGTRAGDALIAHELAHVSQALRGLLDCPARWATVGAERNAMEADADAAGRQVTDEVDQEHPQEPTESPLAALAARIASLATSTTAQPTNTPQAADATQPTSAQPAAAQPAVAPVAAESTPVVGDATASTEPATVDDAAAAVEAAPDAAATRTAALPPDLPLMPDPPTTLSPAEQHRVGGAQRRATATASSAATAPKPTENVASAETAVAVPQAESNARAAAAIVAELGDTVKPSVEIVALCERIKTLILEKRPADEDAVVDSRPEAVASEAGGAVQGDVNKNVDTAKGSYGPIDSTPKGPQPSQAPGIDPIPAAAPTPDVGAKAGTPDAIPPEQVNLDGDAQQMESKAEQAGLNKESAQLVEGGPVGEAREARGEMDDLAKNSPAEVLKQQQEALATSDANMAALQMKALQSLRDARAGHVTGVGTQQQELKRGAEDLRTRLSAKAQGIYESAQSRVQDLLRDVPTTAMEKWTKGLPPISRQFKADLKVVSDQVSERHSGVGGFFVAGWDAVAGLPDWVKEAYDTAEKNFGDSVCTLITGISVYVNQIIKIADEIIADARTQISAVFKTELPEADAAWAAEQEKAFGAKLDALHDKAEQTRTSFNKELIDNAGNAVQAAREEIQKLRKAAGGLWGRFLDAVGRFLDDPVKFIIDGLLELVGISPPAFWGVVKKIGEVLGDIIDAPMKFANNLMDGIGQGFSQFFDNIGRHLLEGLLEWLLSGLKDEGISIEIPKEFSVKSVIGFFLQLLGISWIRIRKLLVEQLGEKAVAAIEKTAGIISTLATKGISGILDDIKQFLDPKNIVDTIVDVAVKYIAETLIVKVAVKVLAMLNPAGAILAAIEAIYRVLKWIFTNAAKIFHLIEAVVNGMADVISGNIGGVAKTVEKALAMLIAPVIDFLADYLGLGGLPGKVANAVKGLQAWVEGVMRSVIKWLVELGKKLMRALGIGGKEDEKEKDKKGKEGDGEVGEHVAFSGGGESHTLYFDEHGEDAVLMTASKPMTVKNRIVDFRKRLTGEGSKLPYFSDDRERDKASGLLDKADAKATDADDDADKLVRQHHAAAKAAASAAEASSAADSAEAAADARVTQEEQSLASMMAELYDLFEEHPGDDKLDMRAGYSGSAGAGEVSYRRSKRSTTAANVMISGPVAGYAAMSQRGRVTAEAAALRAATMRQRIVLRPAGIVEQLDALASAGQQGEDFATKHLPGEKVQPPLEELQAKLNAAAAAATPVANVKLVGGGEIIERAVSLLSDERRKNQAGGVFCRINSSRLEIERLTLESKEAAKRNEQREAAARSGASPASVTKEKASTTLRGQPSGGLVDSPDEGLPAVVVGARGPVVSAIASYEELVKAIRKAADDFGPNLAAAIHGVPVAPVQAVVSMTLRGVRVEKDQDRFLQEVSLLMQIEMVRAPTAWAFAIAHLASATSASEAARALKQEFFPPAQKSFVKQYEKWGPKVFNQASDALFSRLGVEFEKRSGFRGGGTVFLNVDEINTAVKTV